MMGTICEVAEVHRKKEIDNIEWEITDSTRKRHFLRINARSIRLDGGTILYVMRDITERRNMEEKLRKNEFLLNRYQELVDIAQEGIWVIDKDNITIFVNPSMAKMLGFTPQEMIGRKLYDFMKEHGVAICNKNIERRRKGIKEQHDFEFVHKDGHRVYTTIEAAPVPDEDPARHSLDMVHRRQQKNERSECPGDGFQGVCLQTGREVGVGRYGPKGVG